MRDEGLGRILNRMEEEEAGSVSLQFTDITGTLKSVSVTLDRLKRLSEEPVFVDGTFLAGRDGEDGVELLLRPDPSTFSILPWKTQNGGGARMFCSLCREDGTPFREDSRAALKSAEEKAADLGYQLYVQPECEFFLFHTDDDGQPTSLTHERAGYLEAGPVDLGENARREMVSVLEETGVKVEVSRHEISPGQHSIDLGRMRLLEAADGIAAFRTVVRAVARRHGLHATFMPKPLGNAEGSGIHLHFTLFRNGENVFSSGDRRRFSELAEWFAGGLLNHMEAMTAVANPLVNSYKRLVSGTKAPTDLLWSSRRENALIRIPPVRGMRTRVEYRGADGAANPYLLLALCLEAGMDGIRNQTTFPEGISQGRIPASLEAALEHFKRDGFVKAALGEELCSRYAACREEEWRRYERQVTEWELQEYLYRY